MRRQDAEPIVDEGVEARLQRARLLANSHTPDDRAEGMRMLEEIAFKEPWTPQATLARILLESKTRHTAPPQRPRPSAEKLWKDWTRLPGLLDGPRLDSRWAAAFRDLDAYAATNHDVPMEIRRSLLAVHDSVTARDPRSANWAPTEADLTRLRELIELIGMGPALAALFSAELDALARAAFRWSVALRVPRIRQLLAAGDIARATRAFDEFERSRPSSGSLDHHQDDELVEVKSLVAEAGGVERKVSEWLAISVERITEWGQLRQVLDLWQQAGALRDSSQAAPWHAGIKARLDHYAEAIDLFLHTKAPVQLTIATLAELADEFRRETQHQIAGLDACARFVAAATAAIHERIRHDLDLADSDDALLQLAARLETQVRSLDSSLQARFEPTIAWIEQVVANWAAGERGDPAEPVPAAPPHWPSGYLPRTLTALLPIYEERLQLIRKARASLSESGDCVTQRTRLAEARTVAERVLAHHSNHAEALALHAEIEDAMRRLDLDARLAAWDINGFMSACQARPTPPALDSAYQQAVAQAPVLRDLHLLLTFIPECQTLDELRSWWGQWQELEVRLSDPKPCGLEQGLELAHARMGRAIHEAAAAEYARADATPEEDERAAEQISRLPLAADVDEIRTQLMTRAATARIERLIELRLWDAAEALVDQTFGATADAARRLRMRLRFAKARAAGDFGTLATLFSHDWALLDHYLGHDAYASLLDTLDRAWEAGDAAALTHAVTAAQRFVMSSRNASDGVTLHWAAEINDWLDWLSLESEAVHGVTVAIAPRLLACETRLEPGSPDHRVYRWLSRLIARWRTQDDCVSLSWAWRAFAARDPSLMPEAIDPLDTLTRETSLLAENVMRELEHLETLGLPRLHAVSARLEAAEAPWRRLGDLMQLVRLVGTEWPQEPAALATARTMVAGLDKLLNGIQCLERSDVRSQRTLWARLYALAFVRYRDVKAVSFARELLTRVDPLTRLAFHEQQFWTAAERAAEADALDTPLVFSAAADALQAIVTVVDSCGARQTPTWQAMSREYCARAPRAAGDLASADVSRRGETAWPSGRRPVSKDLQARAPEACDLDTLIARFQALERNERAIQDALRQLQVRRPPVAPDGRFDPAAHAPYLALWPAEPPLSRRGWQLFLRVAKTVPFPAILRDSRDHLPSWLQAFIDRGQLPPW